MTSSVSICIDRFLDNDGKVFTPKSFMPFSVGRRVCLGENLAKMELFMFLGGIVQRFHLKTPSGESPPDFEPLPDMMRSPRFFRLQVVKRWDILVLKGHATMDRASWSMKSVWNRLLWNAYGHNFIELLKHTQNMLSTTNLCLSD